MVEHATARLDLAALGERIRRERTERRLSLNDLAARAGVSRSMLSAVERGGKAPTVLVLDRIATGLDTSIARLLGEERAGRVVVLRHGEQDVARDRAGWERRVLSPVLPGVEFELMHGALLRHYEAHIADHTVPYAGCIEALDALLDRGCRLAVITNKIEVFSRKLLDALELSDRFELILGGDTLGPGRAKPAPDMIDTAMLMLGGGRFAMVGDSSYDIRAAKNADVPVVALSFGYNDLPAAELGADAVIDHYDELLGTLEEL